MSDLNKALADAILPHVHGALQADLEARFEAHAEMSTHRIHEALKEYKAPAREIVVTVPERHSVNVGRQHERFEMLVRAVMADTSVWLAGPAGSGKTVGAEKVAESLGLAFSAVSIGPQTTQAHLFGYMDATGTYRGTEVRARFQNGGLLLLDEVDRGNPGVLTALNALLANKVCAFPDGMVHRHDDFRIIAAANTVGLGADRQYVGALQLDAATLDRFVVIDWPYDTAFETELATAIGGEKGASWCAHVQKLREAAASLKIRHVISPRATLNGIRLLLAGTSIAEVREMCIWRGLDATSRDRIMEHAHVEAPDDEGDNPEPAHADPKHQAGSVCPRCAKSSPVLVSRINLGFYLCWKKRGGCGHKWPLEGAV